MAHLTKDPTNKARWTSVYPSYIDGQKTAAQGRRIPKEKAVEFSHPAFIDAVLKAKRCGLNYFCEPKAYSRDHLQRARFRIQIYADDQRTPVNPKIKNKRDLLLYIAEHLPKTEVYMEWQQKEKERKLAEAEKEAEEAAARAKVTAAVAKKGKKGTKKKK